MGESGWGQYHGKYGFDCFTRSFKRKIVFLKFFDNNYPKFLIHSRSIMRQHAPAAILDNMEAPYLKKKTEFNRFLVDMKGGKFINAMAYNVGLKK